MRIGATRAYLRRPALECRNGEEREHRFSDVVEMETVLAPVSLLHHRLVDVSVVEFEVRAPESSSILRDVVQSRSTFYARWGIVNIVTV